MRNGFKVLDTDCHQMEPPGMWAEYIDANFVNRAPAIGDIGNGAKGIIHEDRITLIAGTVEPVLDIGPGFLLIEWIEMIGSDHPLAELFKSFGKQGAAKFLLAQ